MAVIVSADETTNGISGNDVMTGAGAFHTTFGSDGIDQVTTGDLADNAILA